MIVTTRQATLFTASIVDDLDTAPRLRYKSVVDIRRLGREDVERMALVDNQDKRPLSIEYCTS